ncbi:hypothetical protein JXJ21_14800 [candidate division KSB1 bacterium]|nr:hypothetical protein [candidate division KSB1 bacterium]
MPRIKVLLLLVLLFNFNALAQKAYEHKTLQHKNFTAPTIDLDYPINMENIKAIGMGNTQIALGKTFNAMMYNPAFLGRKQTSVEAFGIHASLPPDTYDAAFFLMDNMDEFTEAISLNTIWDGVNAFFADGATIQQRLTALNQIQEGMDFTIDLASEVIGHSENPEVHGITILPSTSIQYGHWGFSLYGFGHSAFMVQQSPTLEALLKIDIPTNMEHPLEAAKVVTQMLGTLATVVVGGGESFSNEVFPVAFYLSYIDLIGSVGYGFNFKENWLVGANLKVVNRRFITDRVAVDNYDEILSKVWENLQSDITCVTCDIGGLYQSPFGTSIGVSLQNIIPLQTIEKKIYTEFRLPVRMYYGPAPNAPSDTVLYTFSQGIKVERALKLEVPLIVNAGISHPITKDWDIAVDWLDIAEQDSRYNRMRERLCVGTEYRLRLLNDLLMLSFRIGLADERMTGGLGLNITRFFQLDGAYAYDRFVNSYSYYCQLKLGW